jgi:hypothetical protein
MPFTSKAVNRRRSDGPEGTVHLPPNRPAGNEVNKRKSGELGQLDRSAGQVVARMVRATIRSRASTSTPVVVLSL